MVYWFTVYALPVVNLRATFLGLVFFSYTSITAPAICSLVSVSIFLMFQVISSFTIVFLADYVSVTVTFCGFDGLYPLGAVISVIV